MLLPDPETVSVDADKHPTYAVRLGTDGRPLLHGASVKGALRSAYETVTASRYGVFRGHDRVLAYRRPASKEDRPQVTPARVESDGRGGLRFRVCTLLAVPLYNPPADRRGQHAERHKARAIGDALDLIKGPEGTADWRALHGREVTCTTREAGKPPRTRTVVDKVALATDTGSGVTGDTRRGWLSITGRSIEQKASERLFVPTGKPAIPVTPDHHVLWNAVLASYHDAAQYNEPGLDKAGAKLDRSSHVVVDGEVPTHLTEGDLVYLDIDQRTQAVIAIHPVMIGRLPYQSPPAQLLDKSLKPATHTEDLSPADRLFGWAAPAAPAGRATSSGYRGRLRIESVRCETTDWLTDHGPGGVELAPLSSPNPTQFRFYAASDPDGRPVERGTQKNDGYRGGLRGRKAYWYPNAAPDGYWTPGTGTVDGRHREWQAHEDAKKSQTSTHKGWVRAGTEFTIRLFADAVPGPEFGPLIWLATQDGCALRLGAGKPLGFGAVQVSIDWPATELRTDQALRDCWLDLNRPEPSSREQVKALAANFEALTTSNRLLAVAVAAWRKVADGLASPIQYPRTQKAPEAETYRWFVANEQIEGGKAKYGFALPHVLEDNQDLPLLPPRTDT
jgi:CRISPR-associated protein (TIGR03986 family)